MATVSFDFDSCLWDESQQWFIGETVSLLREHIENGDRVIICTSRVQIWANEARELLAKHLKLDLEVFSCPGNADDWMDGDPTKSDVLVAQQVIKHFDDLPNDSGLLLAKNSGIEVLLPPATKATITSMY